MLNLQWRESQKFTNCSFREYNKKREKLMCDNFEKEK